MYNDWTVDSLVRGTRNSAIIHSPAVHFSTELISLEK